MTSKAIGQKKKSTNGVIPKTDTVLQHHSSTHTQQYLSRSAKIYAFHDRSNYFANVVPSTDKIHIRVWDIVTNTLITEITDQKLIEDEIAVTNQQVSSLAWISVKDSADKEDEKKAKHTENHLKNFSLLLIGLSSGSFLVYSLEKGKVIEEIKTVHSGPISGFLHLFSDSLLYSSGLDGQVLVWSVEGSRFCFISKLISSDTKLITKMVWLPKQHQIVLGHGTLSIWNVENGGRKAAKAYELPGHITDITLLQNPQNSSMLVSCASNDRHCMIWDLAEGKHFASFALESNCLTAQLDSKSNKLFVVCENNLIYFVDLNTKQITGSIGFSERATDKLHPLIGLHWSGKKSLWIARSSMVNVQFESLALPSLKYNENTKLQRSYSSASVSLIGASSSTVVEMGASSSEQIPIQSAVDSVPNEAHLNHSLKLNDSFETKLSLASQSQPTQTQLQSKSLGTLLAQALNSRDKDLLDQLLFKSDPQLISATITRLNNNDIQIFLRELVTRFMQNPANATVLLPWIKELASCKIAALMSNPSLMAQILKLQKCIENRVVLFEKLLCLDGKMELLIGQMESRVKFDKSGVVHNDDESVLVLAGNATEVVQDTEIQSEDSQDESALSCDYEEEEEDDEEEEDCFDSLDSDSENYQEDD